MTRVPVCSSLTSSRVFLKRFLAPLWSWYYLPGEAVGGEVGLAIVTWLPFTIQLKDAMRSRCWPAVAATWTVITKNNSEPLKSITSDRLAHTESSVNELINHRGGTIPAFVNAGRCCLISALLWTRLTCTWVTQKCLVLQNKTSKTWQSSSVALFKRNGPRTNCWWFL